MVLVSDKPSNDISILQTKFSDREGHESRRARLEAVPLDQHIEGGHGEREARLKIEQKGAIVPVQHGKTKIAIPLLPPIARSLLWVQIAGIARRGMEAGISQDNHLLLTLSNQPLKRVIGDIGRVACPPDDQPPL